VANYITTILTEKIAPQVTAQLQPELKKFIVGGLIKGYLPQTWFFISESGSGTLLVDKSGTAQAQEGQIGTPDVSITWTDKAFNAALALQDRTAVPPEAGEPVVQKLTAKGGTAFDFLRKRFNL
jgi:hypothetical protein